MPKRDVVAEIVERRSRAGYSLATADLLVRLSRLEGAFEQRKALDDELLRYFPVAIVACTESFFRAIVAELLDAGPPYIDRLDHFENVRVDLKVLKAIHRRDVTAGQFVSHLLPMNSFEDINRTMATLLDADFVQLLATVRDRWAIEVRNRPDKPMLDDLPRVLAGVKDVFRLRHIIAHEFANGDDSISNESIERAFFAAVEFLRAANQAVSNIRHPSAPLTQSDMNTDAARRFEEDDATLSQTLDQVRAVLESAEQKVFDEAHAAWLIYRERTARLSADRDGKDGSIWPTLYYSALLTLTSYRADEVDLLLDRSTA